MHLLLIFVFALFKSKENLQFIVHYMDSKHNDIKFTFEAENVNTFSFLYVKITCKTNGLLLRFFVKSHLVEFSLIMILFEVLFLIPTR